MGALVNNSSYSVRAFTRRLADDTVLNTLAGKGLSALLIKIVTAGLTFAVFVLLARWLGPDAYGRYAIYFSLGTFLGFVCVGGLHTLVLRKLPALDTPESAGPAVALVRDGYQALGLLGLLLIFGSGAIGLVGALMGITAWAPIIAMALALPFALAEYQSHVLRGWSSINLALLPRDVIWRLAVIAVIGALMAFDVTLNAGVAFAWTCGLLAGLVLIQFLIGLKRAPEGGLTKLCASAPTPLATLIEARWLAAAALAGAMLAQLSVVLVGAVLTAVDAGAFFASQRTSTLLALPLIAANMIGAPMIARAWAAGDLAQVQRICSLIVIGLTLPTLAGLVLFALAGGWILSLFDPSYAVHKPILLIFATGALVNALCGPTGFLMLMTGHERQFVKILAVSQGIGLGLVALGATTFGLAGAALGEAVGMALWNILIWRWARQQLGVDPTVAGLGRTTT